MRYSLDPSGLKFGKRHARTLRPATECRSTRTTARFKQRRRFRRAFPERDFRVAKLDFDFYDFGLTS